MAPQVNISLWEVVAVLNNNASHRQINGSNEVMFGTLLGGTVLFLPVKWLRAETSYRYPRWL